MNKRLVIRLLGAILLLEAACMVPSLILALIYGDGDAMAFVKTMGIMVVLGLPMRSLSKPEHRDLRAREGFLIVALAWVILSVFGALPFMFGGMIPNFADALFESVSGFTTTGATILRNFDFLPRGLMFWRAFTHWIGGMGVLVLTLALLPQLTGRTSHLVRAESPGPSLSKIVPKMGDSAKILYAIYFVLTVIEFAALIIAGMDPYDAAIHAMSTAGTGGFSNYAASAAAFNSPCIEIILTVFMVLFGINFALFFRLLIGDVKGFFHSEELHWYLGIFVSFSLIISVLITPLYGNFFTAMRYSFFQASSFMSTTGFTTTDFSKWPAAANILLLMLMLIGSCAGSTSGGIKVIRIAMLCKEGKREIRHTFQPRKVQVVRFEDKGVDESMLHQIGTFVFVYIMLILVGAFVISLDGRYDLQANLTSSLTCVSNVGPALSSMGALDNLSGYSSFSKIVMCLLMLAGRLELFPILAVFHPAIWRKG